jgi:hypothetical protein
MLRGVLLHGRTNYDGGTDGVDMYRWFDVEDAMPTGV